jgi:predicted GIY-YIG superfamily endonuclease
VNNSLPIPLAWVTHDRRGQAYRLYDVELSQLTAYGVYMIYTAGSLLGGPAILRVGQGDVANRLREHRQNLTILSYQRRNGPVMVVWASVSPLIVDGVERYLADRYRPLLGEAFPDVRPVPVTLPLAA